MTNHAPCTEKHHDENAPTNDSKPCGNLSIRKNDFSLEINSEMIDHVKDALNTPIVYVAVTLLFAYGCVRLIYNKSDRAA